MEKNHPDLFSALVEFQKEQADSEIAIAEISLGRKVKAAPKKNGLISKRKFEPSQWNTKNIKTKIEK